jgi:glyoxylase-like metal-dependent hydrolase (beta-lactamase superfamily II)
MTLEDHLGDIIRKARAAAGISPEAVARAAGLTVEQLAVLEESGQPASRIDFAAVASLAGLHAQKLEGIANGWQPAPVELERWRELRLITTFGGGYGVNAYLVWDEATREAALFDTGWEAGPVFNLIQENQLQLRHLFTTHGHQDHVAAVEEIRRRFPQVRLHTSSKQARPDQRNRPNDFIHLGSLRITNRDTPGHAEDGVTYVVGTWPEDAPHVAIVGDALFAGSMGKAFGAAATLARQKIAAQILSLPPETLICPGHGPLTTVGEEKAHNPFF